MDASQRAEILAQLQAAQEQYADKLPERLCEITEAWREVIAQDWDQERLDRFHRLVHTMAGSAGTFGLPEVGISAREAEILVKSLLEAPVAERQAQAREIHALLERLEAAARDSLGKRVSAQTPLAEVITQPGRKRQVNRLIHLVEDDELLARELQQQLAYYGFTVEYFTTLRAFIKAQEHTEPAAVVMDLMMPDGVGTKAMALIQKDRASPLPVLVITAKDDMSFRLAAVRGGGVAYFRKPVDAARLIDTLDTLVSNYEEERFRILILEDSRSLAEHFSLVLNGAGMETRVVTDPMTVLAVLDDFTPDMILMDLYMPGCTGFEVAAVIRQKEAFVSIPIVYLSGETDIKKQLAALNLGGDDFLTKPIQDDHLVSAVIARIKRARKLRSLMVRDGLTGLYNHTTTKERLIQEVERCRRQGGKLAFVMIDIDHFKLVNDTYGHPTGDRVIMSLARLLRQRLRQTDIVGRFGGEEFAAILLDTDGPSAENTMNVLRDSFSRIEHREGDAVFFKTFSCGVAEFPASGDAVTLSDRADQALYQAKKGGRNQVVLWGGEE